jgi:hypothetical protein
VVKTVELAQKADQSVLTEDTRFRVIVCLP